MLDLDFTPQFDSERDRERRQRAIDRQMLNNLRNNANHNQQQNLDEVSDRLQQLNLRDQNNNQQQQNDEHATQNQISLKATNNAALERERKEAKKLVKKRHALRTGVFSYKKSIEPQNDQSLAGKLSRLNDLNPESLVGEYLALFTFHFFQILFVTQYLIQQRAYSEALEIDAVKEDKIRNGLMVDDGVRVAYQPLHNLDGSIKVDINGDPVYPTIYPVDEAGNVDYNQLANTNGTASRDAIRANGFVPIENLAESYEIQRLKFFKDAAGITGFTPEQRRMINQYTEEAMQEGKNRAEKDLYDNNAINQANQAQQQAAQKAAAMRRPT